MYKCYNIFLQLLLGIFRLGYLASFLSDPLISGFTCGAAVHVFSSQVSHLFGVPVPNYHGAFKLIYVRLFIMTDITVEHHHSIVYNIAVIRLFS